MYINFELLTDKGYTPDELITLIMILQREAFQMEHLHSDSLFGKFEQEGLISYVKEGKSLIERVRLTKKGKELVLKMTSWGHSDNVDKLASKLQSMYDEYNVPEERKGKVKEIIERLQWFLESTPFSLTDIYYEFEDYLSKTDPKYVKVIANYIWNPSTIYSNPKLGESTLFAALCHRHDIDVTKVINPTSTSVREFKWLSAVVNNVIPKGMPGDMYFTGSYQTDVMAKKRIREFLFTNLKK